MVQWAENRVQVFDAGERAAVKRVPRSGQTRDGAGGKGGEECKNGVQSAHLIDSHNKKYPTTPLLAAIQRW